MPSLKVCGDRTLAFVWSIDIHHQVTAICHCLIYRLNSILKTVVRNVFEEQRPIPRRGLANDHPAGIEALDCIQRKVADEAPDVDNDRVVGEIHSTDVAVAQKYL